MRIYLTRTCFLFAAIIFSCCTPNQSAQQNSGTDTSSKNVSDLFRYRQTWKAPDTLLIPESDSGKLILYGRTLISHTSEYFGPHGSISHSTNGMNCQNCHLSAGTKPYGNNFSAVASTYPKFRARSGTVESIAKRVNDCLERSLNGKPLETSGEEMKAIVAYMKWLGHDVKKDETPEGAGILALPFMIRPADPGKGKSAFERKCISCHGEDGQGKLFADQKSYQYPPLWGPNSYNVGAGLFRLSRFAGFIKANMPFIVTPENPPLTNEDAWDIAAYVNSMQRPEKNLSADWPDISKKPFDYPFGPYADSYTETKHKYGPYAEIQTSKKIK
ncbi:MAG: c-type cytochrome [Bacteroidetes bacterium]|nr:c-type cytochrome [Bacteroidota bacterium]